MENQTVRLDNGKLKEITNASHTSVVTMLLLALRTRARGFSNITATKEQLIRMGEKIVEEDFQAFWKGLQDAGIGVLVYGRRGRPDRFQWHYSLKAVSRVAIEGREELVKELAKKKPQRIQSKAAAPKRVFKKKAALAPKPVQVVEKRLYSIPLRNGTIAEVIIPGEVSASDLEKIKLALTR